LTDQAPTIAASSLFSVTHDEAGDIMGPTLNIVPVNTAKTVAILSYPKEQADAVKMALPELFQADGDKKAGLSKVILQRVENFTISPKFYNAWSEEKRKQVLGAFTNSIMEPKDIPDDIDVSLF
jgi:hypothetical protein